MVNVDEMELHRQFMKKALREAERAYEAGEVPVGALVVRDGIIVGRGHNMVQQLNDPTAHAEMIAITAATETIGDKHLRDCTLYVTLEPCPMCAGAIVLSRLKCLVFGALDPKAGAAGSLFIVPQDRRLNHFTEIIHGVEESHAAELLDAFFSKLRSEAGEQ